MARIIDISGQKFNKLTAIKPIGKYKSGNVIWQCRCDCGNICEVDGSILRKYKQKSCGCYPSERMAKINTKHDGFGTRLYEIWRQMHRRCYGEKTKAYPYYGGRGITVCPEWHDFAKFREWAIGNGYADNLTIDRIDVNGDYAPSNCRWTTQKQQANNRRNNHRIRYNEEEHTISEWADIMSVNQVRLWHALNSVNWDMACLIVRGWFDEQHQLS